jgi:hypothetical protein
MRLTTTLALSSCIVLGLSARPAAQDLLAVSWTGTVHTVDLGAGTTSVLGSSGFSGVNSLAKDASGTLWAFAGSNLITIDATTGAGTLVASTSMSSCRALAFGPGDVLYAIEDGSPDLLYVVDVASGARTLIGPTDEFGLQGMTFVGGVLYGWECGSGSGTGLGLVVLDTVTGAAADVNPSVSGRCDEVQTLAADASGRVLGANRTLYDVDLVTGALSSVIALPADVRGLEFLGMNLSLSGTPDQVSVGAGGSQVLSTILGTDHAAKSYQVLGSATGSTPGFGYGGASIPLNVDAYLIFTLLNPNTPLLNGSAGILNSLGQATTVFMLPPGSDPSLVGLTVHHATLVLELVGGFVTPTVVTNAYPVTLVP